MVVRPFRPATEPRDLNPTDKTRANHILTRVLAMDEDTAIQQLDDVLANFQGRHRNLLHTCEARADDMEAAFAGHQRFTTLQRRLVGAYFLHEYSFEAAALFNPSMVSHPDQPVTPDGTHRFILSLRAVGEGHVSSLTFRSGSIAEDGSVRIDATARLAATPAIHARVADTHGETVDVTFDAESDISERVIFPITASQSNGIEDARFLEFNDEGRRVYYATYTAYSGRAIRSELIETTDFRTFRMTPLRGTAVQNKGMGLFPRRINGRYAMIGRQDNENLYLLYSDDLLTHGVGPMRRYAIGAALLDKADPSRVLARSREPLVRPDASERIGYVPNVVYTCGAMRQGSRIILPYAVSDTYSTFATMEIDALVASLALETGSPDK